MAVKMVRFTKNYSKMSGVGDINLPARIAARAAIAAWGDDIVVIYGTRPYDPYCGHPQGQAIDIMKKGWCNGTHVKAYWNMANFFKKWADEYLVSQIIFRNRIWTMQRRKEGWRNYGSTSSCTQQHMDHIHLSLMGGPCKFGTTYKYKTSVKATKRPIPPPLARMKKLPKAVTLLGIDSQGNELSYLDNTNATPITKQKLLVSVLPSGTFTIVSMYNEPLGTPIQVGTGDEDDGT